MNGSEELALWTHLVDAELDQIRLLERRNRLEVHLLVVKVLREPFELVDLEPHLDLATSGVLRRRALAIIRFGSSVRRRLRGSSGDARVLLGQRIDRSRESLQWSNLCDVELLLNVDLSQCSYVRS